MTSQVSEYNNLSSINNLGVHNNGKSTRENLSQSHRENNGTHHNTAENQSLNPTLLSSKLGHFLSKAHHLYNLGNYREALDCCEHAYEIDAYRTDNLLLLGAIHFQLRNFSESIFYNQQCIRVDANFAEGYSNLGNSLKELGDIDAAIQFYLKAIKLKPRFCDAYNNLASAYVQLGRTKEAIETYEMALVINPGLVDAHSNLGNLLKTNGDLAGAKKCYLEAIRIKPDFAIAWNNLAGVFKDEGQIITAIAYYREAIRLCPDFADAHNNLGNALRSQNLLDEAYDCYQIAVKLRPDFAIAHGNLATCLYDRGDIGNAIKSFKYSIQLEPNYPDAHNNLGNALRELGRLDEAIQSYRAALKLKPDHPFAYNNLGNAMKDKFLFKEAIHCYVTAIRLMPSFAAAHSNLGSLLKEQGKYEQAIAHYTEAINIDRTFADGYSNLGNVYKDLGQIEEAIKCYETAIRIKPTYAEAYANLAAALKDSGRLQDSIAFYRKSIALKPDLHDAFSNLVHSLLFVCDWTTREEDFARLSQLLAFQLGSYQSALLFSSQGNVSAVTSKPTALSSIPSSSLVLPSVQPFHALIYPLTMSEMLQISQRYAQRAKINVALADQRHIFRPKPKNARLHIGYVSSDFGNHPLAHLTQSIFGLHDKSKIEVTCYALSRSDQSYWRDRIESEVEHFKDISLLSADEAATLIHGDNIHILINLNGYTKGSKNEIFALHPAPIQISYLGYCGTMGADYIDYLVADPVVIPTNLRQYYSEKIISMPHSYFVNDHRQTSREVVDKINMPTRQMYGISEDAFVFCNFNQLYKIDPSIFTVWMNIIKRIPNSILWLLRFPAAGEENIRREARLRGVRDEQIVFSNVAPREEHIKRGFLADLFLDTPMCNAHTTACDILWSGTPMITMTQEKMASRVAASLLHAAGLDDLITASLTDYEELAVTLALDPNRLYAKRLHLENCRQNCAAFDTHRWVKNFELGLISVWKRREQGLLPDHIMIEDNDPVYITEEKLF